MSAKTMMCGNAECERNGQQVRVLGGCEVCLQPLVAWVDPDVPTVEQIAYIVEDVSRLEGKHVPRFEIEHILRTNATIRAEWLERLSGVDWKRRLNEIHTEDALLDAVLVAGRRVLGENNQ